MILYRISLFLIPLLLLVGCYKPISTNKLSSETKLSNSQLIAAHRGFHSSSVPENSIQSLRKTIQYGIPIIEIDIRWTKDQQFVLMHDDTINRTTTGKGLLTDYTLEQLSQFRLKGRNKNEPIATLDQFFKVAKGKNILIDLDHKGGDQKALIDLIKIHKIENQIIFFSNDLEYFKRAKAELPNCLTMFRIKKKTFDRDIKRITELKPDIIHIDHSMIGRKYMDQFRTFEAAIWINGLKFEDYFRWLTGNLLYKRLYRKGVNIIQTDRTASQK